MLEVSVFFFVTAWSIGYSLHVVFSRSQVGDRLFSAFGQDIIDALFWTATEPRNSRAGLLGVGFHYICAIIYVCILSTRIYRKRTSISYYLSNNFSFLHLAFIFLNTA